VEENNSVLEIPVNKTKQEFQSENTELDDLLLKYLTSFDNQDSQLIALKHLAQTTYSEYPVDMHTFINDPYYLNLKGQVYTIIEEDLCELFNPQNNYHEAVLTGGIGYGKCFCGSTSMFVLTRGIEYGNIDISFKTIKELYDMSISKKIQFQAFGVTPELKIKPVEIKHILNNGVKDICRVKLTSGKFIDCTYNHPILTDKGYVYAGDLKEGMFIATPRKLKIPVTKDIDINEVKFLAYMIADGCCRKHMNFTDNDPFTLQEFRDITKSLFHTTFSEYVRYNKEGKYSVTSISCNIRARTILEQYGLSGKLSKEKVIPPEIFTLPINSLIIFLDRLFRCDGSYNKNNTCEYMSASKDLAYGVVTLFLRLGIHARLYEKKVSPYPDNTYYRLQLSGRDYRKWCRLIKKPFKQKGKNNPNVDITPIGYRELVELRKEVGGISKKLWNTFRCPNGQYISRKKLKYVVNLFPNCPQKYKNLVNSDIFWDRVKSTEYLGQEETYDLNVPETSNFIANNIITHNSTFSEIAMARMVYECSCLKNPQKAYGLADGSKIVFANVSVTMDKAIKTVFDGMANLFSKSPYFRTKFPMQKRTKIEIRFPKNIEIFPTTDPISLNVFGGIIDEANFMEVLISSAKARGGSYNQAKELHDAFIRRMESRFMERGKLPGILLTLSSAKYNDDFTHELERRARTDPRIFYRRYSQWSTKPKSFYLGEKFYLSLGNNSDIPPEILYKEEENFSDRIQHLVSKGVKVVSVPIEHKLDFENDLHGSIRDIAGYSTQSIRPYITNFAKMLEAAKRGEHLKHPISVTTFMSGDPLFFTEGFKCQNKNPHFCHIDLSLKKDCCGFAVGHVKEYVKVKKKNSDGIYSIEDAPYITIDLMLQVKAKRRSEIEIADIRSIIYELQLKGFYFQYVSFDQFQSADSRQILQRKGINTGLLSVDRNTDAYDCFKNAAQEDRIEFYYSEILFKELKCLEFDERRNKVDHPPTGSKDLADAVAGVCFHCSSQKPCIHTPPSYGLVEKIQPLQNKYPKENELFNLDKMLEMYPFSNSPNYYHNPDRFYL